MKRGKGIPGKRTSKIEYSGCLNTETELVFFLIHFFAASKKRWNANISLRFLGRFKN